MFFGIRRKSRKGAKLRPLPRVLSDVTCAYLQTSGDVISISSLSYSLTPFDSFANWQ
jgi:hypothetical protein